KLVRNFKSKSGTKIICLLVPLLLPKLVSEGAARDYELRKRGTRAHPDEVGSVSCRAVQGCALDSIRLSHFLRRTGVQPGSSPGQAFGGKCSREGDDHVRAAQSLPGRSFRPRVRRACAAGQRGGRGEFQTRLDAFRLPSAVLLGEGERLLRGGKP